MKKVLSLVLVVVMLCSTLAGLDLSGLFPVAQAANNSSDIHEFNGHYYRIFDIGCTWQEAEQKCEELGGHLVTITSSAEQKFVYELVKKGNKQTYWLGATDSTKEGYWEWITGEEFKYSNWDGGQPDNGGPGEEDWIELISSSGKWNDGEYNGEGSSGQWALINHGFICEWEGQYSIKDFAEYALKIIDSFTQKPIPDATATLANDEIISSDENGNLSFIVTDISQYLSRKISITSYGYDDYEVYLSDLDMYHQNTIKMSGNLYLDIQNMAFGKETINGPSVKAFGKEFPLFTVDIGLDLTNIPGMESFSNLKKANNISIDEATKTIQIMIGLGDGYQVSNKYKWSEDYQAFKDYYQSWHGPDSAHSNDTLNKYNKIKDKLKPVGQDVVFKASATYCGYVEIDYSSGQCVIKEGGLVMSAEAGLSQDVPIAGIFYATFGIKGSIGSKILWQLQDSGSYVPSFSASLALTPSLGVGAKLVSKNVASAEVGLSGTIKGELSLPAQSLDKALTLSLTAEAYLKAKLLFVCEAGPFKYPFADYQLYPEIKNNRKSEARIAEIEESDFNLMKRDYLDSGNTVSINAQSVYPYASPKLARLADGTTLAFWLADNGKKGTYNRTTLYYSINSRGEWSTPHAVCENGTADYAPEIAVSDNRIHVLWGRASQSYDENTFDIDTAMAQTELMYSCYENGEFSDPTVVSESTGKYQEMYSVASDEAGNAIIAWLENSENDFSLTQGNNAIYSRKVENGEVQRTVTVASDAGEVCDLVAGYSDDNTAEVSFITYSNDNGEETFSLNFDTAAVSDSLKPYMGLTYQNGNYYCIVDDELCKYASGELMKTGVKPVSENYVVMADGSVVYSIANGFKNELYISYLINGKYSNPVQLTQYQKHISAFDTVLADNGIMIFESVENMNEDETESPYTTTDLKCETISKQTDISINQYVSYEESLIVPGETVSFSTQVSNNASSTIDAYTLKIKDGEETVSAKTINESILPGETKTIIIDYPVPSKFKKTSLSIEVEAENDKQTSNNITTVIIGKADLQLSNCEINNGVITGFISNNGFDTAVNAKLDIDYFYEESTNLTEIIIGNLAAGEQRSFEYVISDEYTHYAHYYDSKRFVISAQTESEENFYYNNSLDLIGSPVRVTGISQQEKEINMYIDTTHQLSATVEPENALDKSIIWISDSTDVAVVDENGLVSAIGKGTAVITAITQDGDFVSACTVNVNCDYDYEKINNDTQIKITGYTGTETAITLPETLCAGLPVTAVGTNAIPNTVKSIILSKNIISVDGTAFNQATALKTINVDEENTNFIAKDGILYSSDETHLVRYPISHETHQFAVNNTVTVIGSNAFCGSKSLTSITIPESIIGSGSDAFKDCTGLTRVDISSLEAWCNISFLNGNSNPLSCAHDLYLNGTLVEELNIPNGVTELKFGVFFGCTGIKSAVLPDSLVSIKKSAFAHCYNLKNIEIPESVTSISNYVFFNCTSLDNIVIPESIKSIEDYTFYECTGLKELTIPASVKIYNSANVFKNCTRIEKIILTKGTGTMQNYGTDSSSSSSVTYDQYTPWYISRNSINAIVIEDGVTSIGNYAFCDCIGLTNITIPKSVGSIGNSAFKGCIGLKTMVVDADNTVYDSRDNCNAIIKSSSNVLVAGCKNTVIPNSVKSIGDNAFSGCTSLKSITIPDSITSMGTDAFKDCTGLSRVDIHNLTAWCETSFSNSNANPLNFAHNLYLDGKQTETIVIPDGVKTIKFAAFYNCTGITSISIPNSVVSINKSAFCYCSNLANVDIPESVTNLGAYAFYECKNLTQVIIKNNNCVISDATVFPDSATIMAPHNSTGETFAANNNRTFEPIHVSADEDGIIEIIEPTCTEKGYTVKKCEVCGLNFNTDYVDSLGYDNHDYYIEKHVAPNCIEEGYDLYACSRCSSTKQETYPKLEGSNLLSALNKVEKRLGYYCYTPASKERLVAAYEAHKNDREILHTQEDVDSATEELQKVLETLEIKAFCEESNKNIFWSWNNVTKTLTINGEGKLNYFGIDSAPWKDVINQVEKVYIQDGITSVCWYAFSGAENLKYVYLPETITQIDRNAFENCTSLESIVINDNVTKIDAYAFKGCTALKKVSVPASVIYHYGAFQGCTGIERIIITKGKDGIMPKVRSGIFDILTLASGQYSPCRYAANARVVLTDEVTEVGERSFNLCTGISEVCIYSRDCTVFDDKSTMTDTITIKAYSDSKAKEFADKYNRSFTPLDDNAKTQEFATVTYSIAGLDDVPAELVLISDEAQYHFVSMNGEFHFFSKDIAEGNYRVYLEAGNSLTAVLPTLEVKNTTQENRAYTAELKLGDIDKNGMINVQDIAMLLTDNRYGNKSFAYDLNGDNYIDIADLSIILRTANYGMSSTILT